MDRDSESVKTKRGKKTDGSADRFHPRRQNRPHLGFPPGDQKTGTPCSPDHLLGPEIHRTGTETAGKPGDRPEILRFCPRRKPDRFPRNHFPLTPETEEFERPDSPDGFSGRKENDPERQFAEGRFSERERPQDGKGDHSFRCPCGTVPDPAAI